MKQVYFVLLISVFVAAGAVAGVPNDGDILLWIGEGSGNKAADGSGNGKDGTFSGGAKWVPGEGKYGAGIALRGEETFMEVPNAVTEVGSLLFWFKPDWDGGDGEDYRLFDASLGAIYFMVSKGANHADIHPGEFGFYFEAADDGDWQDVDFDPSGTIKKDTYFHCAVTWDFTGGPPILYIDGNEEAKSRDISGGFPALHEKPRFGWESVAYLPLTNGAEGVIDEISFWQRALTADEINDMMEVSMDVEAAGKLASTWGDLKMRR